MPTAQPKLTSIGLPVLPPATARRITPTDLSQFARLEQCERFLRLWLAERAGYKFMEPYDVTVGQPVRRQVGSSGLN